MKTQILLQWRGYRQKATVPICFNSCGVALPPLKGNVSCQLHFASAKIGIQSGKVGRTSLSLSTVEGQLLLGFWMWQKDRNEGASSTICSQESTMEVGLVQPKVCALSILRRRWRIVAMLYWSFLGRTAWWSDGGYSTVTTKYRETELDSTECDI